MPTKIGTKNIKKLLQFGFDFSQSITSALADGKVSWIEAIGFVPELMQLQGVVKSWPLVKQEIADLDSDERADLCNFAVESFDIPNDQVEEFVETAGQWAISTLALIELAGKLKKYKKAQL
jgi:hypothetical protein